MIPFTLEMPGSVTFGSGSLSRLSDVVRERGTRVTVLSGSRWLAGREAAARALAGCAVQEHACRPGEPSVSSVAEAAAAVQAFRPDVIVAVGGGAVLDTAKAVSALVRYPGSAERFLEGLPGCAPVPGPGIPWIAVPTTAGTGAEVTKNAVIKAESVRVKRSMRSRHLLAQAVIVDPELTRSLPLAVTGTSGLDAFTQLIEAYVSRSATPPVKSLVEGAFAGMWEALDGLPRSLDDLGLREKASYGSLVSGIALANAGLGAAHGFAAAVGGMFDVPHGLACAVFLPAVLHANRDVIGNEVGRLVSRLGKTSGNDPVGWLASECARMLGAFGLPSDLRGFAIPREKAGELAEKSSGSSMKGNPREIPMEERQEILLRIL